MDKDSLEVRAGIEAVRRAATLCQNIGSGLARKGSLLKSDRSPVTIADFGSQAMVCRLLREKFPGDPIVGEEDSAELRKPGASKILQQVTTYVRGLAPGATADTVCSWIDYSSRVMAERFWALDPIDGTKGFLRGGQYAIALALIEKGVVNLGLMACPNLHLDPAVPPGKRGCVFVAVRGKGAFQVDGEGQFGQPLSVSKENRLSQALFTESVEPDHADQRFHQRLAERLGISKPALRMDSQAKYGIVARGEATFYIRVPSPSERDYKEKIWDHAAGSIIAEEAGGRVTDVLGHALDFSCGITLARNHGILVSNGVLHEALLKAVATGP